MVLLKYNYYFLKIFYKAAVVSFEKASNIAKKNWLKMKIQALIIIDLPTPSRTSKTESTITCGMNANKL